MGWAWCWWSDLKAFSLCPKALLRQAPAAGIAVQSGKLSRRGKTRLGSSGVGRRPGFLPCLKKAWSGFKVEVTADSLRQGLSGRN